MAPYGQQGAGMMAVAGGTLQSAGSASTGPMRRNALMTMLIPFGVIVGGSILGTIILAMISPSLAIIGSLLMMLLMLGGSVLLLLSVIKMVGELKTVTRNESFAWWHILIPLYNYYWLWILVPQEVTKAKQALGVQVPTRGIVFYIFLFPYALASDINDMVR